MALASQTGGPVRRNRYMYRRRRSHPFRWIGLMFLVAIVGIFTWYMIPELEDESPDNTNMANATRVSNMAPEPPKEEPATPVAELTTPEITTSQPVSPPVVVADASVTTADTHAENKTETDSNVVPIPPTLMVTQHSSTDGTSARVTDAIELSQIDPITARKQLSELLAGGTLSASDRDKVRSELTMLGSILLFDPSMLPNDSYSRRYTIQGGDSLARIAARENINVDWRMIQRINRISNPDSIRVGQSLKLPVGTFHAIVYKSEFILELYLENEDGRILVATFPVGLGEFDGTPLGRFKVKPKSKLINPQWTNPRTGEFFSSHEPNNPIGERWIGLSGLDPDNSGFTGYGIHGTIDPNSIGQMKSMGCVRLRNDDVAIVYEALSERESTIAIRP